EANRASAEAARRVVARLHPGATAFDELHALDYLEYAYLQSGRDAEAARVLERTRGVGELDVSNFAAAYALAAVPARHALERRDWAEAAALTVAPASFPWARHANAEAMIHYARALGAARRGDLPAGRESLARVAALRGALAGRGDAYWAGQVDVLRREAAAWIAHAEGRHEEAVRLLHEAADAEDLTDKSPVT